MNSNSFDIAVIGGGASGMMAALAARWAAGEKARICVLERLPRVGRKLMATGNGRCNLTNMHASAADYHGDVGFMDCAMTRYPPDKVLQVFQRLGVEPFTEPDGRVYPMSGQASSVLDALRLSMSDADIIEMCAFQADALARRGADWLVKSGDGQSITAKRVIVATGGLTAPSLGGSASGYKLLEKLGHTITPRLPALTGLKTDPSCVRALKGIRVDAPCDVLVDGQIRRTERGDVLFTEYGLSGPAIFQLSRIAAVALAEKKPRQVAARVHVLPWSAEETTNMLIHRQAALSARPVGEFLTGLVNKRLGQTLLRRVCALPFESDAAKIAPAEIASLGRILAGWEIPIIGTMGFEQAQVTCGGVSAADFNPSTMESKLARGIYATGEVYNIDGDCGGFNLQWAWASALQAGERAGKSLQ